jgi:hypothetical protein
MSVRHWPLFGDIEQFYSGGFIDEQEDLRKLLRQIARWMEHDKNPNTTVNAIAVYPYVEDTPDVPTTWAANVWLVPTL